MFLSIHSSLHTLMKHDSAEYSDVIKTQDIFSN